MFTRTVTVAPDKTEKIINSRGISPATLIATVVCAMAFLLIFREPEKKQVPAEGQSAKFQVESSQWKNQHGQVRKVAYDARHVG